MKYRDGFVKISLLLATAIAASACGPLAPSVSKLSGAGPSGPTDGSSPTGSLVDSSLQASGENYSASKQQTLALTSAQFKKQWNLLRAVNLSIELEDGKLDEFRRNGAIAFSSDNNRISGREDELAFGKIRILFAFNVDSASIAGLGLNEFEASLKWNATTGQWELSLVPPNTGDPALDTNEANELMRAVQNHLVRISVVFQTE